MNIRCISSAWWSPGAAAMSNWTGRLLPVFDLVEHRERRHLGIAEVGFGVGARRRPSSAPLPRRPRPRTRWPFLPNTSAVPVSWHMGSTPAAAMLAFLSRSSATKRSLADASGVVEDGAELAQVRRAQQVAHVVEGLERQLAQRVGLDAEHGLAVAGGGGHARRCRACARSTSRGPSGNMGE